HHVRAPQPRPQAIAAAPPPVPGGAARDGAGERVAAHTQGPEAFLSTAGACGGMTGAAPTPSLVVSDVARAFGRHQVLRSVTFAARRGEMVGIVGENGAGKSTLLQIIAGLLPPSRGRVDVRGRIGYCPPEPQVHLGL